MKTNLDKLRELALEFLELEPEVNERISMFVYHPFFDCRFIPIGKKKNGEDIEYEMADIFKQPEKFEEAKDEVRSYIKNGTLESILLRMSKPYRLTYLKYAKEYMSKDDFEKHLIDQWISSENPNQDVNISIDEFIEWFSQADRKNLMSEKELNYFNSLPEEVTVYRGIAVGRAEKEGLSWTCNYGTAKWFANRFNQNGQTGYVLKGTISKNDIFAYLNSRKEDEILCNSSKVKNIEKVGNE